MRSFLYCIIVACAIASVGLKTLSAAQGSLPPPEKFHIYLLMGQSNMAGRGKMTDADRQPPARILKFDEANQWVPGNDPLHFDKSARPPGVGPGSGFGPAMAAADPTVTIGLVPCAVGGTPLARWVKGADLYEAAVKRAKLAMKDGILKGVIWHQGETDSNSRENSATYGKRLAAMIADLRRDLSVEAKKLPFVVGMLGDYFEPGKRRYAKEVNAALSSITEVVPNTACVEAAGLKPMEDNVHFSSESARELGRRYAVAMLRLQSRE